MGNALKSYRICTCNTQQIIKIINPIVSGMQFVKHMWDLLAAFIAQRENLI